jgi:hypothetical protein
LCGKSPVCAALFLDRQGLQRDLEFFGDHARVLLNPGRIHLGLDDLNSDVSAGTIDSRRV